MFNWKKKFRVMVIVVTSIKAKVVSLLLDVSSNVGLSVMSRVICLLVSEDT